MTGKEAFIPGEHDVPRRPINAPITSSVLSSFMTMWICDTNAWME